MSHYVDVHGDGTLIFDVSTQASLFTESQRLRWGGSATRTVRPTGLEVGDVAWWGADNAWPQRVVEEMRSSDLLRPLARKHAKRMIGQGLCYGTSTIDEVTGEERLKVMRVREIDQWLRRTNINLYLYGAQVDWIQQGNVFSEIQMGHGDHVAALYHVDATRCRLSRKDSHGRIKWCYISGKWREGASERDTDTIRLPTVDPYYDVAGQVLASKSARMVMPMRLLVDDQDYYGEAPWHGLIHGGYLALARAIISAKRFLTENLTHIRYHVEIGSEFWELHTPGFSKLDAREKSKVKAAVTKAFTKWATGQESAGRTLVTDRLVDDVVGKKEYRSLWKITPLKLDIPEGAYIEDSAEVDSKIIRAFMDQSLFGQTPSKDRNSAGSGSDKRVAHTHELLDNQVDNDLLLTPLDVVSEVNGWNDKYGNGQLLRWWFRSYHAATLDRTLGAITENKPSPAAG